MNNEDVKKTKKVLDELSQNENERRLAELREKYIMDQKAIEAAGYDKGLEDGIEQGKKQGFADAQIQIVKEMKSLGYDNDAIKRLTKMTIKEIEEI